MKTSASHVALGGVDVQRTVGEPRRDNLSLKRMNLVRPRSRATFFDIGPDLGSRRIFARPVVIGVERKFVLTR